MSATIGCRCGRNQAGVCFDIDGNWWNGHGPADEKRAPVQRDRGRGNRPGTIPWETHEAAWKGYAAAGHGSQSAERIAERGGFSYLEVQCALAGHYNQTGQCGQTHPMPPGWEPLP